MLDAIAEIESFVVGEAARHIPDELEEANPTLPWKEMRSTRNFIVHIYHEIEPAILWDTIKNDIAPLKPKLEAILSESR